MGQLYRTGAAGAALLLAAFAVPGAAETRKDFPVSASIVNGCSVALTSGGHWGVVDFGALPGVTSGTVQAELLSGAGAGMQIECTPGTQLSITADGGNQSSGGMRQLGLPGQPAARIPYQLYVDGSATPWSTQAITIAFPQGTSRRLLPIRGKATLTGAHRAGTYTDTVRVTLAW